MHSMDWLYWGVVATCAQMLFEAATQGLKLTRMSLPFILGSMYTPNRSRAKLIGTLQHIANGLLFTFLYVLGFHLLGVHDWWHGALIGLFQGLVVLLVGMNLLAEFHPRMATERAGPTARRQLEPPGFMALNYGLGTPVSILVSHLVFGTVVGQFCDG